MQHRLLFSFGPLTLLAGALALSTVAKADSFGFTSAGPSNYALLSSGGMDLNVASITGNVADAGALDMSGTITVSGFVEYTGTLANTSSFTTPTLVSPSSLAGAISNAGSVYSTDAALATTVSTTFTGAASSPVVLSGGAGQNVLDLSFLDLSGTTLTISSGAASTFIINVGSGGMNLFNSSILLAGGITPGNVLFDLAGGGDFASSGLGTWGVNGIVLAANSSITTDGTGTVCGELIGDGISITGPFNLGCSASAGGSTPEPATSG